MRDYITKHGLKTDFAAFVGGVERFIAEMQAGLSGASSLAMLPTYLCYEKLAGRCERVIVMDAGGTNLRISLVSFDENKSPVIEYLEVYPMPGSKGRITVDEFFATLAEYLVPIADKSSRIGFCFSYPCEVQPNMDGKVLHMTKEVDIEGAAGALIGEGLRRALAAKNLPSRHSVVVINDTVATLLGAIADSRGRVFDGYIGFILGTGTNCAYAEKNANIGKVPVLRGESGSTIINMESGNYDKAQRSAVDAAFDDGTLHPGRYQFEKMISGAYQGSMMLAHIKSAARDGCFSGGTAAGLMALDALSGRDIDDFCYYPYGDARLAALTENESDRLALYDLLDALSERSAVLTCTNLAAVVKKTGAGKSPLKPVCISAEGTTFYKSKLLHEKIVYYMAEYMQRRMGLHCELMRAANATIFGTAMAAQI